MNPDKSLASAQSEELPWLAFLYVSEELTPEEVQDFEERLMADQAAREAVAQAMKMSEGLWMASAMDSLTPQLAASEEGLRSAPRNCERSRLMIWLIGTIAAASLAFCIGWWFAQHPGKATLTRSQNLAESSSVDPPNGEADVQGAEQLLEIWTDSQSLLSELESGPAAEYSPSEVSARDHSDSEEEEFSWMLAAVSVNANANPPAESDVMEN